MSEGYSEQHRKRIEITISELSKYVTLSEKTLNVGVSDMDSTLLRFFKDIYFGVPSSIDMPKDEIKRRVIQLDITSGFTESEKKFDVIIFTEVMEHLLVDDEVVVNNLYNLLSNRGLLVLSVPNAATFLNRFKFLFGQNIYWNKSNIIRGVYGGFGHIREYTFSEVKGLLSEHFDILCIRGVNGYRRGAKKIINFLPKSFSNTILVICRKKPELLVENLNIEESNALMNGFRR